MYEHWKKYRKIGFALSSLLSPCRIPLPNFLIFLSHPVRSLFLFSFLFFQWFLSFTPHTFHLFFSVFYLNLFLCCSSLFFFLLIGCVQFFCSNPSVEIALTEPRLIKHRENRSACTQHDPYFPDQSISITHILLCGLITSYNITYIGG